MCIEQKIHEIIEENVDLEARIESVVEDKLRYVICEHMDLILETVDSKIEEELGDEDDILVKVIDEINNSLEFDIETPW